MNRAYPLHRRSWVRMNRHDKLKAEYAANQREKYPMDVTERDNVADTVGGPWRLTWAEGVLDPTTHAEPGQLDRYLPVPSYTVYIYNPQDWNTFSIWAQARFPDYQVGIPLPYDRNERDTQWAVDVQYQDSPSTLEFVTYQSAVEVAAFIGFLAVFGFKYTATTPRRINA